MQLHPQATGLELAAQNVDIPAGEAKTLEWPVQLPIALAQADEGTVRWTVQATDRTSGASDALTVGQRLLPAVPLTVQQSTLVQMEGRLDMPVQWPAQAVLGKGGFRLAFSERLADPQQGVPVCAPGGSATPTAAWSKPPASGGAERCGFVGQHHGPACPRTWMTMAWRCIPPPQRGRAAGPARQ